MMKSFHTKKTPGLVSGFTLIETLVSLFIFASSITVLLYVSAQGIFDTNYAKNKSTAIFLTQEGVELARNYRDTSMISGMSWGNFVNSITPSGGDSYIIDPLTQDPWTYTGQYLDYNSSTGFFGYGSGNTTRFRRIISFDYAGLDSTKELRITSAVEWSHGLTTRTISASEIISSWMVPF